MTRQNSKLLAIPTVLARSTAVVVCALGTFSAGLALAAQASAQRPTTTAAERAVASDPQRDAVMKGFNDRVSGYIELRKQLEKDLPKPKPGDRATGKAESHEDTLAKRIEMARKNARPGAVFGDAAPYIKQIIERDAQTRGIRDAYAAMQEVPAQSPPAVNAPYPEKAALATVPPLILVNLPRLPDGLEYRFMGRDLILRDREANVIVDFVTGAVPVLKP